MIGQDGKVYLHGKVTIFKIYDVIPQYTTDGSLLFKSLKGTYHDIITDSFNLQGPALTMQSRFLAQKTWPFSDS